MIISNNSCGDFEFSIKIANKNCIVLSIVLKPCAAKYVVYNSDGIYIPEKIVQAWSR